MTKVKATILLDEGIKKNAQLRALQENASLSSVINSFLEVYTSDMVGDSASVVLDKPKIITKNLGLGEVKVDRNFTYELD